MDREKFRFAEVLKPIESSCMRPIYTFETTIDSDCISISNYGYDIVELAIWEMPKPSQLSDEAKLISRKAFRAIAKYFAWPNDRLGCDAVGDMAYVGRGWLLDDPVKTDTGGVQYWSMCNIILWNGKKSEISHKDPSQVTFIQSSENGPDAPNDCYQREFIPVLEDMKHHGWCVEPSKYLKLVRWRKGDYAPITRTQ